MFHFLWLELMVFPISILPVISLLVTGENAYYFLLLGQVFVAWTFIAYHVYSYDAVSITESRLVFSNVRKTIEIEKKWLKKITPGRSFFFTISYKVGEGPLRDVAFYYNKRDDLLERFNEIIEANTMK